jgi:hypothetical protein
VLLLPFPYVANTAGWMTAELGRQPWLVYGLMRTIDGASPTVSEAAAAASRAAGKGGAVRAIPVEEARKTMGPMADALAMDQVVVSARGGEVGWAPRHPPFPRDAPSAFREWSG